MAPSVYDGAPTRERHDHYGPDGQFTGHTIVTRDSPWTTQDRAEAEALYLLPGQFCSSCGQDADLASDPMQGWDVEHEICWACRSLEINQRRFAEKHEDAKPDRAGAMPDDGVTWRIEPYTPGR